jgi:hypothetical protein
VSRNFPADFTFYIPNVNEGGIDMKKITENRAPLASPGEIVLVLLTISFFLLLLAPSLVSQ